MSVFYICHCGNLEKPHNFRHPYESIAKVERKCDQMNREYFVIDASVFPERLTTRCGVENCFAVPGIHGTPNLEHKYVPIEYKYREINVVLPGDSQCNKCVNMLSKHRSVMTHNFTTKILVENKGETDRVTVMDPEDEDIKIIWQ
jgi:hypothetical protein